MSGEDHRRIQAAIRKWKDALGEAHVIADPSALALAETATFATDHKIPCIIQPGSTAEVQACVRVAHEFKVPLYPVSRGRNWGLGSRVPASDGCVLVELWRMNRIVDFSERHAYLTVEPGVTFQQGFEFLETQGSKLMLSCTGGPKDGSILGNALERGDGSGPLGNRAELACNLEVVLPDGELMRTGPGQFNGARTAAVTRDVPGPGLDGLFFQSNFGIVTGMTVWLLPKMAFHRMLQLRIGDLEALPPFIDELQRLMLEGVIPECCAGIYNCYKTMMPRWRFPWKLTGGKTPFRAGDFTGREPWTSSVLLYAANEAIGLATERHVMTRLGPLAEQTVSVVPDPASGMCVSLGIPGDDNCPAMYWRKRRNPAHGLQPEKDRCGVIWFCPAFPFEGGLIAELFREFDGIIRRHGLEPSIGLNCASPRCIRAFIVLFYDRDVPSADEQAMACHDELFAHAMARGCYPYRLGIQSMASFKNLSKMNQRLVKALKQQLDPNGIISPGRYD